MITSSHSLSAEQLNAIEESLKRASMYAIRQAAIHSTNMVVRLNGVVQTIKPEQHPLYTQAMPQGLRSAI
jgi:hypothetical protein